MTGASRDPGLSANFRYTTSTDMTRQIVAASCHHATPGSLWADPTGAREPRVTIS